MWFARNNKMFDIEKFISAVKQRPALYNLNLKEYNDKDEKLKLWDEVGAIMYENWHFYSYEDKNNERAELQKKWKTYRDQFLRELKMVKMSQRGIKVPKKRRYLYYDYLLFLKDYVKPRYLSCKYNGNRIGDGESKSVILPRPQLDTTTPNTSNNVFPKIRPKLIPNTVKSKTKPKQDVEDLQDQFGNRSFLMSVLPLMDRMSEDQYVECRLRIMQVVQECRSISSYSYDTDPLETEMEEVETKHSDISVKTDPLEIDTIVL